MASEDTAANIETDAARCRRKCARTFRGQHGAALPGGPFPGTQGEPGDVRRCEHGRVWAFDEPRSRFEWPTFDLWESLGPLSTPIRYRRAVRSLSVPGSSGEVQG